MTTEMLPEAGIDLDHFRVDLQSVPYSFWKQLGEAKSKCEHLGRAPLMPEFWQKLHTVYLVKGAHATTAIEGNTLTEDQVMAIYQDEAALPPSREYQRHEVVNILDAMAKGLKSDTSADMTLEDVRAYNTQILRDLTGEDHVTPGEFRRANVGVGRYRCPDWERVDGLMESFIAWYNSFPKSADGIDSVSMAIIKAIAAHVYFVLIHPFGDGNGRTARLIEWRTLDAAGIATPATHLLSNHYNLTRDRYYRNLDAASMGGNLTPFLSYAIEGFVDQLAEQLKWVYEQYAGLVYDQSVRMRTPGRNHEVVKRREELAIAIMRHAAPVKFDDLRTLTPSLSRAYAGRDDKTVTRDINALTDALLIGPKDGGYEALLDSFYWRHQRDKDPRA